MGVGGDGMGLGQVGVRWCQWKCGPPTHPPTHPTIHLPTYTSIHPPTCPPPFHTPSPTLRHSPITPFLAHPLPLPSPPHATYVGGRLDVGLCVDQRLHHLLMAIPCREYQGRSPKILYSDRIQCKRGVGEGHRWGEGPEGRQEVAVMGVVWDGARWGGSGC